MRLALVADVHANAAAMEAVIADIDQIGVERSVCLGDVVGYNAEPVRTIELIREHFDVVVMGNHDRDVLKSEPEPGTRHVARLVQSWTRSCLDQSSLDWIAQLPRRDVGAGLLSVHGCFLNKDHVTGYVTATMLPKNLDAIAAAAGLPKVAACGHTHQPMLGWRVGGEYHERRLSECASWPRDAEAVLINPGSVGQPRDRDWRASYAVVNLEACAVELRRVEYDLHRTQQSILEAGLPEALAVRLGEGR